MKRNNLSVTTGFFSLLLLAGLIAFDQLTKYLAVSGLKDAPLLLIKDVFSLRYVENRGIGFGLFQGKVPFILVLNIAILLFIVFVLCRLPVNRRMTPVRVTLLFTVAGALGNILDRLRLGYVVDFFSFDLINFPVFNMADIYVTVSIVVFAILYLFYLKTGELEGAVFHGRDDDHSDSHAGGDKD